MEAMVQEACGERTIAAYMREFMETRVEPFVQGSTYRTYLEGLLSNFYPDEFSELPLSSLSQATLERYYNRLLKGKSRRTVELMATLMKRLCSDLYERGLTDSDLSAAASLPRERLSEFDREKSRRERTRKRYFTDEDILKLFRAYRYGVPSVSDCVLEWCPVIVLQLETFLRASEVISLFAENVDLTENVLWVRNTVGKRFQNNREDNPREKYIKIPKNGEERVVPLSPLAREAVERMMSETRTRAQGNPNGLLYPFFADGRMRTIETYERNFKTLCDALHIDRAADKVDCRGRRYGLNTHALRHTGITMANTADGANVINTALMAGHSVRRMGGRDLGAESVYIHAVVPALRRVKTPSVLLRFEENENEREDAVRELLDRLQGDEEKLRHLYALLDDTDRIW